MQNQVLVDLEFYQRSRLLLFLAYFWASMIRFDVNSNLKNIILYIGNWTLKSRIACFKLASLVKKLRNMTLKTILEIENRYLH